MDVEGPHDKASAAVNSEPPQPQWPLPMLTELDWEAIQQQTTLLQQAAQLHHSAPFALWAIIDGANWPEIQHELEAHDPPHACLYSTLDEENRAMAPWLVKLDPDNPVTERFKEQDQINHSGIVFSSNQPIKALREHFRLFTMLWTPADDKSPMVYDSDIFKIEVPLKEEGNESANAQDMMPFYKKMSGAISNKLSFPSQDIESDPTQSYIKINQAFNVKDAGFKIVELDDKNDVGIEGKIKVSFDSILGVEINVDIVDAVLTALKAYPALSGISSAIKKARSRAALGVSTADSKSKASFHAGINLTANSKVTAEYTVSKVLSEKKWKKEASGSGVIGLEVRAVVKGEGEGETYFIKGSFDAEGKAKSEVELKLSGGSDKNYAAKCELEFSGIKLEYKAKASLGGPRGGISKSNGGEFVVLDKSSLGSFTI